MFPLAIILSVGALKEDLPVWRHALASIPGLGLSLVHALNLAGVFSDDLLPCVNNVP
jgi:hypothetical protein